MYVGRQFTMVPQGEFLTLTLTSTVTQRQHLILERGPNKIPRGPKPRAYCIWLEFHKKPRLLIHHIRLQWYTMHCFVYRFKQGENACAQALQMFTREGINGRTMIQKYTISSNMHTTSYPSVAKVLEVLHNGTFQDVACVGTNKDCVF